MKDGCLSLKHYSRSNERTECPVVPLIHRPLPSPDFDLINGNIIQFVKREGGYGINELTGFDEQLLVN